MNATLSESVLHLIDIVIWLGGMRESGRFKFDPKKQSQKSLMPTRKLSALQREVLQQYRSFLRMAYKKPLPSRLHFLKAAKEQFRDGAKINKREINTIEFMLRKGDKQLRVFSSPECKDVSF